MKILLMNLESGMEQSVCALLTYSQARFYAAASFETSTSRPSVYFHQRWNEYENILLK